MLRRVYYVQQEEDANVSIFSFMPSLLYICSVKYAPKHFTLVSGPLSRNCGCTPIAYTHTVFELYIMQIFTNDNQEWRADIRKKTTSRSRSCATQALKTWQSQSLGPTGFEMRLQLHIKCVFLPQIYSKVLHIQALI